MSQTAAAFAKDGKFIPHTPAGAVTGGNVVLLGAIPTVAPRDIAAAGTGDVDSEGTYDVPKTSAVFEVGDDVLWDADGTPVSGDASSGAATNVPGLGYRMGFAVAAAATGDAYVRVKLVAGPPKLTQGTPTAETNTSQTYTAAEVAGGIITSTQTGAVTGTLDTGANMDAGFPGAAVNDAVDWTLINLGSSSGAVTLTAATGHTIVGSATVAIATSARLRSRRTADDTWVTYRLA